MIFLGRIKTVECGDFGDDGTLENVRIAELLDISFGDALLFRILIENRRTVLRAPVRALPVLLRGIVRHRKKRFSRAALQ